jgi:hypothetical protein
MFKKSARSWGYYLSVADLRAVDDRTAVVARASAPPVALAQTLVCVGPTDGTNSDTYVTSASVVHSAIAVRLLSE